MSTAQTPLGEKIFYMKSIERADSVISLRARNNDRVEQMTPYRFASLRIRALSVWLALILSVLWIAGCGGGGGDGDVVPAPVLYPVTISSPTSPPPIQTDSATLAMSGTAFVPTGSSCQCIGLACFFGHGTLPDGYRITWTNVTTGYSDGYVTYYLNCLLFVKVFWNAQVSLAPGYNLIRVTAVDISGNTGQATLEVTRLPDSTPPQVLSIGPVDGATEVSINVSVGVKFNEVMDAASVNSTTILLSDISGNSIPSSVVYSPSTNISTLTPNTYLAYNTNYRVTVTTGVRDLAGNALLLPFTTGFTTTGTADTTPPDVVAVTPPNGCGSAGTDSPVTVTFNENINVDTLFFGLMGSGGLPVAGSVSYQVGAPIFTFHPDGGLNPGSTYTATVASGVKDYVGNTMVENVNWTFRISDDGVDRCVYP